MNCCCLVLGSADTACPVSIYALQSLHSHIIVIVACSYGVKQFPATWETSILFFRLFNTMYNNNTNI